mmetsp:Transcript_3632/g.8249  ORF Transcript_3632/g.8249 Transcript_3632/m.8249 type:complete len:292 (-) Transcript_3632:460-1335(-)
MMSTSCRTFAPALTSSSVDFPPLSGTTSSPRKTSNIESASSSRLFGTFISFCSGLSESDAAAALLCVSKASLIGVVVAAAVAAPSCAVALEASSDSNASRVRAPPILGDVDAAAAVGFDDRDGLRLKPDAADERLNDLAPALGVVFLLLLLTFLVPEAPMASLSECISYRVRFRTASVEDLLFPPSSIWLSILRLFPAPFAFEKHITEPTSARYSGLSHRFRSSGGSYLCMSSSIIASSLYQSSPSPSFVSRFLASRLLSFHVLQTSGSFRTQTIPCRCPAALAMQWISYR